MPDTPTPWSPDLPAPQLARALIGARLLVDGVGGRIVETEAYEPTEPASHSYRGRTARNGAMFGPPLTAYVYRSYGIHWCFNIVAGPPGHAAAALIRALEPTEGLELMARRRGSEDPRQFCSGPGKLTQALGLTQAHDGLSLLAPPFTLEFADAASMAATGPLLVGPRIGITKAIDAPWRFGLPGSPHLSRRFPAADLPV